MHASRSVNLTGGLRQRASSTLCIQPSRPSKNICWSSYIGMWPLFGSSRKSPRGTYLLIIRIHAGSIVSCCPAMTSVGTVILFRSAVRSQCSRMPLAPISLGPCIGT